MKRLLIAALLFAVFSLKAQAATDTVYVVPEKSGIVAAVLSLVIPGAGNFYAEDNTKGSIFLAAGLLGYAAIIKGVLMPETKYSSFYEGERTSENDVWIGAGSALILGSSVASAITAYISCKPSKPNNVKITFYHAPF